MLPILMGLGAKWSARAEMERVRAVNATLQEENGSYRAATGELTSQIQSLEGVINDLGARATLDPEQARAMQKLPAVVKARAAGGSVNSSMAVADLLPTALTSPEDTFGLLRERARRAREPPAQRAERSSSAAKSWPPRRRRSGRRTGG